MANTWTFASKQDTGQGFVFVGSLALTGNYATGGIDISDFITSLPVTEAPFHMVFTGKAGYQYEYDVAAKKLLIRQQTDPAAAGGANIPLVELAAAALPAGVTGDTIQFVAWTKKFS